MEQFINFIIRPPRAEYNTNDDLLDQEFMLKEKLYKRKDLEVTNSRGNVLQCSHYMPAALPDGKALPCVIYCHGNSGSRADASEAAIILLPSNITVFAFDFAGSGLSGGEHVTLGWYEKNDLKAVVDYLRADGDVSLIGLWGRSMGAVSSLLYGAEDPSIAGMVVDSPFSVLVDLMMEVVDTYKFRLPKFTVKIAIQYMRKAIQRKAKFDITELNIIEAAKSCFVPVLIGYAVDDDFIRPHHSNRIYEAYVGDKNIIKFEGDHNSPRPHFYFDSISFFFINVLNPPKDEVVGTLANRKHGYSGKVNWGTLHKQGSDQGSTAASKEPATRSTENTIEQVCSKRPMSRTQVPDIPLKDITFKIEDRAIDDDQGPSSSGMISFEFSGQPNSPHVPTNMDDDDDNQYVEYTLDDLTGFPCDVYDEERMFMEAVLESLKELKARDPHTEEQPSGPSVDSLECPKRDDTGACGPLNVESTSPYNSSVINTHDLASKHLSRNSSGLSTENVFDTPSLDMSESTRTSSRSDTSGSIKSFADTDISGNTKATLTVLRNPASNLMNGLMRRWDLSFFRNGR